MSGHALRGAVTAWLALIALEAVSSSPKNAGKVASLFADVNNLVARALSPNVAAIPDRRSSSRGTAIAGPNGSGADGTHGYLDPNGRYIPPSDTTIPQPSSPGTTVHSDAYQPFYVPSSPVLT